MGGPCLTAEMLVSIVFFHFLIALLALAGHPKEAVTQQV